MTGHSLRIDALRGAAVIMVMQVHLFYITGVEEYFGLPAPLINMSGHGSTGVDLFFVLSSFLLTRNLLRQPAGPGVVGRFYVRRAFRILPLYWLLIFGGYALEALWLRSGGSANTWLWGRPDPISTYLLFVQNWRWFYNSVNSYFYAPTWSLAVEEHFYLLLPLLATRLRPRSLALLAVSWIALTPLVRNVVEATFVGIEKSSWTIYRLDAFGWGMLLALAQVYWPGLATRRLEILAAALAMVAVTALLPMLTGAQPFDEMTCIALFAALAAYLVITWPPAAGKPGLPVRILGWFGKRCYSLYLLHWPILGLVFLARGRITPAVYEPEGVALLALSVVLTLVLSDLSYRFIERPLMRLAGRLAPDDPAARREGAPVGVGAATATRASAPESAAL